MAIIKIKNKIFKKYFQVEVQTEHIIEEEKWTQKPPNLTITSDLEDSDLIRENLLGCGGGKQVSSENGGFTGATPPPSQEKHGQMSVYYIPTLPLMGIPQLYFTLAKDDIFVIIFSILLKTLAINGIWLFDSWKGGRGRRRGGF